MVCPYCHATDHQSLAKCPRWTGRADLKIRDFTTHYGTTTARLPEVGTRVVRDARIEEMILAAERLRAESDATLKRITNDCPHCRWVQDGVAVCDEHAPAFMAAVERHYGS